MVDEGRVAVVHYVGRIAEGPEEGEVFDASDVDDAREAGIFYAHRDYRPLQVEVGAGEVFGALDEALRGAERGDTTTVEAEGSEVFGERDEDAVVEFPREVIEEAEEGSVVKTEDGRSGWVTEADEESVVVDFNHELADTRVEFEVRVVDVLEEKREFEGKNRE